MQPVERNVEDVLDLLGPGGELGDATTGCTISVMSVSERNAPTCCARASNGLPAA
ncbi:MAG TPA: hypothetical protein VII76_06720 [Acidimicrobiales bacterium]